MNEERPSMRFPDAHVSQRFLRLARLFGWTSLGLAVLPPVLISLFGALAELSGLHFVRDLRTVIIDVSAVTYLLFPVLALVSAIVSTPTIRGWRGKTSIRVDEEGLHFHRGAETHVMARNRLTDAIFVFAPKAVVDLCLVGGDIVRVEVPTEADGQALIQKLGFAPDERRVTITLASPQRMLAAGCVGLPLISAVMVVLLGLLSGRVDVRGLVPYLTAILLFLLVRSWRPPEVVVGADGVLVRRPFQKKYHSFASLGRVDADGKRLRFLHDAQEARASEFVEGEPELVRAAASRIEQARAARAAGVTHARVGALLERGDVPLAEWRQKLSGLLGGGDYRSATVTPEALLSVLEDPAEDRGRRIGAAMLLRIAAPDAAPRIRIAAQTSADDALRAALELVAEQELDDATLERALRVTRAS